MPNTLNLNGDPVESEDRVPDRIDLALYTAAITVIDAFVLGADAVNYLRNGFFNLIHGVEEPKGDANDNLSLEP